MKDSNWKTDGQTDEVNPIIMYCFIHRRLNYDQHFAKHVCKRVFPGRIIFILCTQFKFIVHHFSLEPDGVIVSFGISLEDLGQHWYCISGLCSLNPYFTIQRKIEYLCKPGNVDAVEHSVELCCIRPVKDSVHYDRDEIFLKPTTNELQCIGRRWFVFICIARFNAMSKTLK